MNLQAISQEVLGNIEWRDSLNGFLECPGKHLHKSHNSKKDCKIYLNGAPTIYCFHDSCYGVIEAENYKLRRALCGEDFKVRVLNQEDKDKIKKDIDKAKLIEGLKYLSKDIFLKIKSDFPWNSELIVRDSPQKIPEDTSLHCITFIRLFEPRDIIWNGDVKDSGDKRNLKNFQMACEFLGSGPIGNFTCPSIFRENTYSRSNENVLKTKFLVVESDSLSKDEIASIFKWLSTFLKLRAIVDTAGKSLHGWFDFPSIPTLDILKIMLPEIGCDRALFKISQPVRMPGVLRGNKYQKLLWINI